MDLDPYILPEVLEEVIAVPEGWEMTFLDVGEIHVTTPQGQKFRLVCEAVPAGEDFF